MNRTAITGSDASPALRFACTSCGRCCHGLRLVLSMNEAIAWATRGGVVQILCHAGTDTGNPEGEAAYRRACSFIARSGDLPIRVQVLLVARFEGACPNLGSDMRCGIYPDRPDVCRIYPAQIMPGHIVDPAERLCPPEAWDIRKPPFLREGGAVADPETDDALTRARAAGVAEVSERERLTALLGIDIAAVVNEGFAVWTLPADRLIDALRLSTTDGRDAVEPADWRFASTRPATRELIASVGANLADLVAHDNLDYLSLHKES